MNAIVPIPKIDVSVREATLRDVPFIDSLQKTHDKHVGFMRTSWLEGKTKKREVIVAEDAAAQPVGYCMGVDKYSGRQEVGIVHQLNVVPGKQRSFVGATLLKAMFDRAAYGCRLFCCWCAQDIDANYFWESMGFVALAYRAGSEKKRRIHIFWQKRIRDGDDATPWWFPSETNGGALGAPRLVFPIPSGKHWSDEMPVILPGVRDEEAAQLPGPRASKVAKAGAKGVIKREPLSGGLFFAPPATVTPAPVEKAAKEKKPRPKNDPKLVAAARELRDRWLEHVNSGATLIESSGKYDVTRALPESVAPVAGLLPAA